MEQDLVKNVGIANLAWLENQYQLYLQNPSSIAPSFQAWFGSLERQKLDSHTLLSSSVSDLDLRVLRLIEAYRAHGHLMARVNPLAPLPKEMPTELQLATYGIKEEELSSSCATFGFLQEERAPLAQVLKVLESIYSSQIGFEFVGNVNKEIEDWLKGELEPYHPKAPLTESERRHILQQLNRAELLEAFLHTKYVGQKRFSLEGAETLIPMLASLIEQGSATGVEQFVLGMSHRGRLNVLCNIFNKSYAEVFSEFDENYVASEREGSGDVKYHKGFSAEVTISNKKVGLELVPNPSHLEAVDPVVEGITRALQSAHGDRNREKIVPLLIHGDAALAGQGVIYETVQLYRLEGYTTGGTLHIVINNQIGFTTLPRDLRSTCYCTAIARGFGVPVLHVNAEEPESCLLATKLAFELRQKFHCDVFLDLYCYRKYGHNEGDEPAFTQPKTYRLIRNKKSIREIYLSRLVEEGLMQQAEVQALEVNFKTSLQQALQGMKVSQTNPKAQETEIAPVSHAVLETKVEQNLLSIWTKQLCTIPESFKIHPKIAQLLKERQEMGEGKRAIDWGMAETLAYASLLWEGHAIRLSGQDCCRGTFSHRHASWIDQETEKAYIPFQHLEGGQTQKAKFEIYNSPLSENAALGFEFGYSVVAAKTLVIWEAQFGDFANGAQVVIDQFIIPSEEKWGQVSSVTLFLPHGYEGQGPEHSSARMERFLTLAGDENIIIVNPTTPAQFFHLLRRQAHQKERKPLIIFTPKGLLRHPQCVSSIEDLTHGHFEEIIDDQQGQNVKKILFCSGKIYYELLTERTKHQDAVAILRIEQLYPLDQERLKALFKKYEGVKTCLWVQEEPSNMGAWDFIQAQISPLLPQGVTLSYVGRERSAATAVGSYALHKRQQAQILEKAFKE